MDATGEDSDMNEDVLTTDIENVNNVRSVSKELFSKKNIQGKTQLSAKQINAIARVQFMQRWLNDTKNTDTNETLTLEENLEKTVEDIELLSASHNRKSREEFVESMKIQNAQAHKETFWGNLSGQSGK